MSRYRVLNPAAIDHAMRHPRAGKPYTNQYLADAFGVSKGTINNLRSGRLKTVPAALARQFTEATGYHEWQLFAPKVLTESNNSPRESA